ncbi:MAG: hypothetical protein IT280_09910 [Ignavibacteria bacterium]|nr:hypothetical protein [Ignavibacteria bacterium]
MRKNYLFLVKFLLLVVILIIYSSCGNDNTTGPNPNPPENVDTSSFQYPFTIGSKWFYTVTLSAENIRPDSIRHYFSSYPLTGSGYSEILYDTIVPIGGPVRVIYDRVIYGTDTIASRYYYTNTEYSMVCYGYRGPTTPAFPFKKFNNKETPVPGLFSVGQQFTASPDSFYAFSTIVINLKYPVVKNTEWQMFDFGNYTISKKYLSWENYHLDTSVIPCIKTQRINTISSDYIFYDYYSKYGQMKRDNLYKNKRKTNDLGLTIGFYDYRELINVTSFQIAADNR